jgi:uncharacterized membrane protein YkoI
MSARMLVLLGLFASTLTGCSTISTDEAKSKAMALIPGATVVSVLEEGREKIVVMQMTNGGAISVELEGSGEVEEVFSKMGPFDYELTFPEVLPYSQARTMAMTHKAGALEAWECAFEKNIWEFYVRASSDEKLWEIKLDAKTGALVELEQQDVID